MLGSYAAHEILSAVIKNDIARLKNLLDNYPDCINEKSSGTTPLCKAAYLGEMAIVHLLVDRGARLDIQDDNGCTPLMNAFLSKDLELVEYLIDQHETKEIAVDEKSRIHLENLYLKEGKGHKDETIPKLETPNPVQLIQPIIDPFDIEGEDVHPPITPHQMDALPQLTSKKDGEITQERSSPLSEYLPPEGPKIAIRHIIVGFVIITFVAMGLAYVTVKLRKNSAAIQVQELRSQPTIKPTVKSKPKPINKPVVHATLTAKPNAEQLAADGIQCIDKARYKDAVVKLKSAIHLNSGAPEWYYQLGRAASQTHDNDLMVWTFKQYKVLAPIGPHIQDIETRLSHIEAASNKPDRPERKRRKKNKAKHKPQKRTIKDEYGTFPNIKYFRHNGKVYYKDLETGSTYQAE